MVREITKDIATLQRVSKKVRLKDKNTGRVVQDLIDTARAHRETSGCVGLAAIQIGEPVRVIVVRIGDDFIPLLNPVIVRKDGFKYIAKEGCLSLDGIREVERYHHVEVMHQTAKGFVRLACSGFVAEILQHEIDHLDGKLI